MHRIHLRMSAVVTLAICSLALLLTATGCLPGGEGDGDPGDVSFNNGMNNGGTDAGGDTDGTPDTSESDGGTESDGLDLGVPGDTVVADFTAEQKATACDNLQSWGDEQYTREDSCKLSGLISAAFSEPRSDEEAQTACASARDDCLNSEPEPSNSCAFDDTGECTATVDEVTACMESQTQAVLDYLDTFSCAGLTLDELQSDSLVETPQECVAIQDTCPSIGG